LFTDVGIAAWGTPTAKDFASVNLGAITGCEKLSFDPTIRVRPTSLQPNVPTGYTIDVNVPQNDDASGLATAHLKDAKITFPEGVVLAPGVAHGLGACSDSEINLLSNDAAACPDSSKIGTLSIKTPLLSDSLSGSVYVGSPLPGNRYRMFLYVKERGVTIKLEGKITLDPSTGQVTATFLGNPQLPFSNLHVALKGGENAPLANPHSCGTKTVKAELSSYAGNTAAPTDSFVIAGNCGARGFAPTWTAGSVNGAAGASSPFELRISRSDDDQEIDRVSADLPAGLLGYVSKVARCSAVAAAAGACPAASQIGKTTVSAGPGSDPFAVGGEVFLTDGYDGAPFGLLFHTRVVAGPYDLGDVDVQAKITVDPVTAQLHVESGSLPRILDGIPLQIRSMRISIDREGFMRNPTGCGAKAVSGSVFSTAGAIASVSSVFGVGSCDQLALRPELEMSLTGARQTTDGKHPGVEAVLTQPDGQAAIKKASVALPLSLALDPDNAQALCEFVDGQKAEPTCPAGSIVGTATATTPILNVPLTGPVYFVKNIRIDPKSGRQIKTLPTLAIPLKGEGVSLIVRASSSVVDDHLVTTFDNLPDASVTKFVLNIAGGAHGILAVSNADICKTTQIADQQIDGHNNKQADTKVVVRTPACPLKVVSKKVGKTSVAVTVSGLGAGKVTVTGKGIRKTTKTITKSTVATVIAKRTKAKPGKVTVSFDPAGPAKARKISK
jgi:hypothetical protein